MYLVQTVAPTKEPITLAEAKLFMRILEDDDDALITSMIVGAREYAENYTNRQLMPATFELTLNSFAQDLQIPKAPLNSITKIEYMDVDGMYQTLDTSLYYSYGENGTSKLHFESGLPTFKDDKRAVKITFTSGYTTVPSSIVSFIKVLVSTMYENREQYVIGVSIDTMANPLVFKMLDMYRVRPT